jgi:hypothetical protein
VVSWRTPNTYLTAVRAGDRHLNFHETRDNLHLPIAVNCCRWRLGFKQSSLRHTARVSW